MKKQSSFIILMLYVLFNILAFSIPSELNSTFWLSYALETVIFLIVFSINYFIKTKNKTIVINLTSYTITYSLLLLSFGLFFVFKFCVSELWIPGIVYSIIIFLIILNVISFSGVSKHVENVEKNINQNTNKKDYLLIDVECLKNNTANKKILNALDDLLEDIKFSDPMSDESINDLETQIEANIKKIDVNNENEAIELIKKIRNDINIRNKKIKVGKGD